jgi:type IV pilus assembly protein PilA
MKDKRRSKMRKGFTLLELIVVIIIIGVLGALGFIQYTRVVEKGRSAEAKDILGQIRSAQAAYMQENNTYTGSITDLYVEAPTSCATSHYFAYTVSNTVGTAARCTSGGKSPNLTGTAYTVSLTYATGVWGGSAGYF